MIESSQNIVPKDESIQKISGMYESWFLDYASYVILERAIPSIYDGLKPVQRRILHSMKELDDGRYNKVANIVGNTMKYHPHGDAAISDAIIQLGQKELLIDTQGNWGNILTGDKAAASRYIEARLTKFGLDVVFNPKTTEWQSSYDGRNKEPVDLPIKFPLLLAQGVEGIAVGLSTKILPHNFNELINASINHLKGKSFKLFPDFLTSGMADVSNYNDGMRGGKIRVRAKIIQQDKNTLVINEIPYGTTTSSLIDSILKANDKGKIKIKKIEDNTAANVEILIHLSSGISPNKMIDALYAFTDCEISISPLCCVIDKNKPLFIGVSEILKRNTDHTVQLLRQELEIALSEHQEHWHFASLERIFIENRIYRDIEKEETWEGVIKAIDKGLKPHTQHLVRDVTKDDIIRLTDIRIKRISKFDLDKAQQYIQSLEDKIADVKNNLKNLIDYAIDYFKAIKSKYGKGKERRTELRIFDDIQKTKVAIANTKFYVNREEGFIGTSLKRDEFLFDCSDIDDIIIFKKDGTMIVTKVDSKTFVGKDIIHVAIWKKKDKRTVYNLIYRDGKIGYNYMKRFSVTSITRDKEYTLTQGNKGSQILYFTANPNGEAEIVTVHLKALQKVKKLRFDIDFTELAIKGQNVKGNLVSKHPLKKIELKEMGVSTLAARKIWFDDTVRRLNVDQRGMFLGEFQANDKILIVNQKGIARLISFDLGNHFEDNMIIIEKWCRKKPISCIYYDAKKSRYYIKRFLLDDTLNPQSFFSLEDSESFIELISTDYLPIIEIVYRKERGKDQETEQINVSEFITVKGIKAQGNTLTTGTVKEINALPPLPYAEEITEKTTNDLQTELNF